MYELLIQDKEGVWRTADLGNEKPAMNYQVNNLAELKDLNSNYSRNIKIPITKNNCLIFGFSNLIDAVSIFPYRKHNCRLFFSGYTLVGRSGVLILRKITDFFECVITSGNRGFFESLKNLQFSDLDLGQFRIVLENYNPEKWNESYELCLANFINTTTRPSIYYQSGFGSLYPFVKIPVILDKIFEKIGYTLDINTNEYLNKALSITTADVEMNDFSENWDVKTHTQSNGVNVTEGTQKTYTVTDWEITIPGKGEFWRTDIEDEKVKFTSKIDGTYNLRVLGGYGTGSKYLAVIVYLNGELYERMEQPDTEGYWYDGIDFYFQVETKAGDIVEVLVQANWNQFPAYIDPEAQYGVWIEGFYNTKPSNIGGTIEISQSLGFDTFYDFMVFFAQAFGLTYIVDEENKTIKAFTFDLLYSNIKERNVKDWTAKAEKKQSFSFDMSNYAQKSIIKHEDNDKENIKDEGILYVDNTTLAEEKVIFTLKTEAGHDVTFFDKGFPIASIPLIDWGGSFAESSFLETNPHLVELSTDKFDVIIVLGVNYEYRKANHVFAQSIVDTSYPAIEKVLSNSKIVERRFYLTPADIQDFDHTIPVYVDGRYFYVNKIRNFVNNQLTTCELIRL